MKMIQKFELREIVDLLIEFVYLMTIFAVPIYFSAFFPTYNVFELSKLFIFRTLVWCLFFLTTIKIIFYWPKNFTVFKKYFIFPTIFIVGLGISLFFSGNIAQSFFGSYGRQAGYLNNLFYFAWFVLLVFNIRTINNKFSRSDSRDTLEKRINRIIFTINLSGLIVAAYGILQIMGIDFLSWPENPLFTRRTFSTFGQPNFLASWLLLVFPLAAYSIYNNKKMLVRFFYFLVLAAEIIALFFTSSRGGVVAFGLTVLIAIIYLIFFTKIKRSHKIWASSGLLIIMILGAFGLNLIIPGRFSSLTNLKEGSTAVRVNFYNAAYDAILSKPLFGYGLENSGEILIDYYRPDWGIFGDVGAVTDRVHNLVLDIILTTGLFGLVFFIILFYYFFSLAFKNIAQNKMRFLSLAIMLGAAGYLLSLMFSFSLISGEVYFWLFLALLIIINLGDDESELFKIETKGFNNYLGLARIISLLLITGATVWGINYEFRVLEADHYFNQLYYTLAEKQYFTAFTLASYMEGENTNKVNQEYYNRFLGDKLSDFYPSIDDTLTQKLVAFKLLKLDKILVPGLYENNYIKAKINATLGNYSQAEKYFQDVTAKTPYWPKTYLDLGSMFVKENKITQAIVNYQLLLKILPDVNDSRLNDLHKSVLQSYRKTIYKNLGDIYFQLNNFSEAEKNYQQAYLADTYNYTLFKNIADTYYQRGDYKNAIEYNIRGAARNPSDYSWPLAVALIYKEQGNKIEATRYFNQALKIAPNNTNLLQLAK